jgi:small-conductance mechanosensitive channel
MLEKRFAEAGVTVAYPQRDVHLNAARPLQVEVVASARPAQAS